VGGGDSILLYNEDTLTEEVLEDSNAVGLWDKHDVFVVLLIAVIVLMSSVVQHEKLMRGYRPVVGGAVLLWLEPQIEIIFTVYLIFLQKARITFFVFSNLSTSTFQHITKLSKYFYHEGT
jgi:hypothetical protein